MSVKCRLTKKGLKVLVERNVHAREFPEFDCFDPLQNGKIFESVCGCTAWNVNQVHPKATTIEHDGTSP